MNRDLHSTLDYKVLIVPQVQTNDDTAIVSEIIDVRDYDAVECVIALGTLTDAGVTTVVLLEEGDNSSLTDNAAVADADMLGTETLAAFDQADDKAVRKIGYTGTKRYIRLTVTPTGNAAGDLPISAVAVCARKNRTGVILDGGQDG